MTMKTIRFIIAAAICLSVAACKKDPLEGVTNYYPQKITFHEVRSSSATNISGTINLEWDENNRLASEVVNAYYDAAPTVTMHATITYTYDPDGKFVFRKRVYKSSTSEGSTVTYARMVLDKKGYVLKTENTDQDGNLQQTLSTEQTISDGHVQKMVIAGCKEDLVWKQAEGFAEEYSWNKAGDLESVKQTGKNLFVEGGPLYTYTYSYDTSHDNPFCFDALIEHPSYCDGIYQCKSVRTRHLCTGKTSEKEVRKYSYEFADGKVTKLIIGFLGGAEDGYKTEYTFTY